MQRAVGCFNGWFCPSVNDYSNETFFQLLNHPFVKLHNDLASFLLLLLSPFQCNEAVKILVLCGR